MNFPTLFKLTSTGATQYWEISTKGNVITTRFGQVGGKEQETTDAIAEGKNLGKANATTPEIQAEMEAQAKWDKQRKKNYVQEIGRAMVGETDVVGGFDVQLAHKFRDHAAKIRYPCAVQPKLDGLRLGAVVENDVCTLWSRTKKPITGIPHIARAIEALAAQPGFFSHCKLDGEAFVKDKATFEKITSFVRQQVPAEGHEIVQFHCYDLADPNDFSERSAQLAEWFKRSNSPALVLVETQIANNEAELMEWFYHYLSLGYEGAMARNLKGGYEGKRSYNLQKIKEFLDDDFKIIGVNEGRGRLIGHVGSFRCVDAKGVEFDAKMEGKTEYLEELFEHPELWRGKLATVRYQNLTGAAGVPRFPIVSSIREPGL